MNRLVQRYIDRIVLFADRDENDAAQIRAEIHDNLATKIADLRKQGLSEIEAVFAAVEEHGDPKTVGYSLRTHRWIDIRTQGTARGFIAVGPQAVGTIAIGGLAVGIFACGVVGVGLVSLSAIGIALLWSFGAAIAIAPFGVAHGGIAIGLAAAGVWSCGLVTLGYESVGPYARQWGDPGFVTRAPGLLAYLDALIYAHTAAWSGPVTSLAFHTLACAVVMCAGFGAFRRRAARERREAGYSLLRFG